MVGKQRALIEGLAIPADAKAPMDPKGSAPPRYQQACRDQVELRPCDLDSLLPLDHKARLVWGFVQGLDLQPLYQAIQAVEGGRGRSPIDPAILMSLWLYATLEGVGSARELARLTERDDAYRWICGGVRVNYHTLSDFRVNQGAFLDEQLTRSVASLMAKGLVTLNRVAQDGMRVRASAGASSYRRKPKLKHYLREAKKQVKTLKAEAADDPAASQKRQQAARQRAAEEREQRIKAALAAMPEADRRQRSSSKKRSDDDDDEPPAKRQRKEPRRAPRVSTTDPDAPRMKMADGGFRPAYNVQFATDTRTGIIAGVSVINTGSDFNQMIPMADQLQSRYHHRPDDWLADGGFAKKDQIQAMTEREITVYAPVQPPKHQQRQAYTPRRDDPPGVAQWRRRMATDKAQAIYRERAPAAEWPNAQARNRGLHQFPVRGLIKANVLMLWQALAHNLERIWVLDGPTLAAS